MTVVNDELHARWPHSNWDARAVAYLDLLITQTDYQPTPWEKARLEQARNRYETSTAGGKTPEEDAQ